MADLNQEILFKKISVYRYSLPIIRELEIWGRKYIKREGILLKLVDKEDRVSWGEVAPIPFDSGAVESCISEFLSLRERITQLSYDEVFQNISSPSGRFGLYSVIRQIDYRLSSGVSLLSECEVSINALLLGSEEEMISRLKRLYERGTRIFKLKIVEGNFEKIYRLLNDVKKYYGESISFILDFNRKFDLETALELMQHIAPMKSIRYIEDPVENVRDLVIFLERAEVKVGVDEFLVRNWNDVKVLLEKYYEKMIFIMKPSILFGLDCWNEIVSNDRFVKVFTSSWETGVGTRAVLRLSYEINGGNVHTGIDTYSYLAEDICSPKLDTERGKISIDEIMYHFQVDESRLDYCGDV